MPATCWRGSTARRWARCARCTTTSRKQSLTGLPLVHLGLALSLQGDKARGEKAIAEGFAFEARTGRGTWATTAARCATTR